MKNPNDTIGNRTRDLPACSAVPQLTAPPRAPIKNSIIINKCLERCIKLQIPKLFKDGGGVCSIRYPVLDLSKGSSE
jgi:hypothetical protein